METAQNTATSTANNLSRILDQWENEIGVKELQKLDKMARKWLQRKHAPYRKEVFNTAQKMKRAGVFAFNLFPRMGCTTAITKTGTLLQSLDFPTQNLGRYVQPEHKATAHGNYLTLGWEGFSGVCTGIAKDRFAIAYSEAPFESNWWNDTFTIPLSTAWPPMWLIRYVLENCKTYEAAKYMLCTEKLATPAIFTLLSPTGRGCIIERTEKEHYIHSDGPMVSGNHWRNDRFKKGSNHASKPHSEKRVSTLKQALHSGKDIDFRWCLEPVINKNKTAFAAEINLNTNKYNIWKVAESDEPKILSLTQ